MILPDTCVQEAVEANRDRICSEGELNGKIEIAEIHLGVLADFDEKEMYPDLDDIGMGLLRIT